MKLTWLLFIVPPLIAIIWVLSRFQFRLSILRGIRARNPSSTSFILRDEESASLPMPEDIVALIKQGRQDAALRAMRELTGGNFDGRGTIKTWTSDDGTVHVESRTVTFEADELPPEVIASIRDGDMQKAMTRLRGGKTLLPPGPTPKKRPLLAPMKKKDANEGVIPSKDEINDPKPQPFPLE